MDEAAIDALCDRYYTAVMSAVRASVGRPLAADDPVVAAGLAAIGRACGAAVCLDNITVASSPDHALQLTGESYTDGSGLGCLNSSAFDLAGSEVLGEAPDPDTTAIYAFQLRVYDTLLSERETILIPYPHTLHFDADDMPHCATGPAVAWPGQDMYYWHGQQIDRDVIEAPESLTANYLRDLPAEKRRASYEALGYERVIKVLGAKSIDEATLGGLHYELWSTDAESWLRMQSPPLQDGSQPYYVEPVHERCLSCAEALGWRATGELGVAVSYGAET